MKAICQAKYDAEINKFADISEREDQKDYKGMVKTSRYYWRRVHEFFS